MYVLLTKLTLPQVYKSNLTTVSLVNREPEMPRVECRLTNVVERPVTVGVLLARKRNGAHVLLAHAAAIKLCSMISDPLNSLTMPLTKRDG